MKANLKPFDLKAALAGEPVMLRDGRKAYVRHHETELVVPVSEKLLGFLAHGKPFLWCEDGAYFASRQEADADIIGMWPKTRMVNGFEVPAPETNAPEDGDTCYISSVSNEKYCVGINWGVYDLSDKRALSRGIVFLNKEDAIANAKAMLGIDPYKKVEE